MARQEPDGTVVQRTVGDGSIPIISQQTIEGFFTPPDAQTPAHRQATALSDTLIAEIQLADTLLIAVPIYNFSIPAALKAWIDQVVRVGHTFAIENGNFKGLVRAQRAVVVTAYGSEGYLEGQPFAAANFLQPYLKFLLGFVGIQDVSFVSLQGTTGEAEALAKRVDTAKAELAQAA